MNKPIMAYRYLKYNLKYKNMTIDLTNSMAPIFFTTNKKDYCGIIIDKIFNVSEKDPQDEKQFIKTESSRKLQKYLNEWMG